MNEMLQTQNQVVSDEEEFAWQVLEQFSQARFGITGRALAQQCGEAACARSSMALESNKPASHSYPWPRAT